MARKQFQIIYPDGSKRHIGRTKLESMIHEVEAAGDNSFRFTGIPKTAHSMSDFGQLLGHVIYQRSMEYQIYLEVLKELKRKRYIETEFPPNFTSERLSAMAKWAQESESQRQARIQSA